MHRAKKPTITDLNQHLTCKLCKGYFIDATTIIECLHSFCRSCIVKYLETNKYCPVCDVQVHKTKPLLNIRTDKTLQDIVYKLVPRLFQNEVQRRRDFYLSHPEAKPNLDQIGENYQHIITPDESVSLTMCYYGCKESARYLRCPAAVSVGHLQKLIRAKYGLFDNHHVDILYNQDCLNSTLTLMDVAYIYSWKRKAPIELSYRIYEYTSKKPKLEAKKQDEEEIVQTNNNNWKEVQLRISENGEMSIIQDEALELVNNNNYKPEIVTVVDNKVTKKELPELKFIGKCTLPESATTTCVTLSSNTNTTTVFSTINSTKCSVSSDSDKKPEAQPRQDDPKPEPCVEKEKDKGVKRKSETPPQPPPKPPKQTILNHSIGLHNLSNNHPLKKHSQLNKTEAAEKPDEVVFSKPNIINKSLTTVNSSRPGTPKPVTKPCYMPKPVISVPKPSTSIVSNAGAKNEKAQATCPSATKAETKVTPTTAPAPAQALPQVSQQPTKMIKSKPSTPIGYKTLRDPPKSWNSQIAKANINKPISDPKYGDLKNVRPAKFFKMRNNLPRYLGNPASGVKPMYQVHVSPEKEKEKPPEPPPKGEIKKHSIVKIDPKTLKPISEKAPETTSLSNSSDLKINTSSVSIFNPLKLQNSPKGERKSPKSPHSPKTTSTKVPSSPPTKRDKLNLNFTPSNPFIPNLASPTVSPNQFLYPTGPPGFPPYDPRVMAAYHNLFYGQRLPFPPPGLSMELNQRKNFDLAGPTSPKLGGMPQPHSPQPPLKLPTSDPLGIQTSSRTLGSSTTTTNSSSFKPQPAPKKSSKESTGKNEKSLQNAVEKLTQNRVKEIKNEAAVNKSASETKQEEKPKAAPTPPPPPKESTTAKEKEKQKEPSKAESKSDDNQTSKKKEESESAKEKEKEKSNSNTNGEVAKSEEKAASQEAEEKKKKEEKK
ncbi:hypothetical protein Zmor_019025 [Zophobas morio]|uniref:RING-type domain-containing protein n=1 Tax=Zophobas morio TaxID=2755281 RepID=A0AA38MEB0_9CUCU|nr:hypothetical protein Zmor_019025 [Zophobas morio]